MRGDGRTIDVNSPQILDRTKVARLLRTARSASSDHGWSDVDWAYAAAPESRAALRMKIIALLDQGDTEAADALLALSLLRQPTDVGLSLLSAHSLLLQGRCEEADRTIRLVLPRRARHVATLTLAGRIAAHLHQHDRAIDLLQRALGRRPDRIDIVGWLIESLLAIGSAHEADRQLRQCESPPLRLKAQVLRARGCRLEAIALIDARLSGACSMAERSDLLVLLIDLLEETADHPRLFKLGEILTPETPEALLRMASIDLSQGRFSQAMARLSTLPPHLRNGSEAIEIVLVASAMLGRMADADQAHHDLERIDVAPERLSLNRAWRRGLMGSLIAEQQHTALASVDPNPSLLAHLTGQALMIFERSLNGESATDEQSAEIAAHRAICRFVLGEVPTPAPSQQPSLA